MEMLCSKDVIEGGEGGEGGENNGGEGQEGGQEGLVKDVPLGLRNQRRIWALVEDLLDLSHG